MVPCIECSKPCSRRRCRKCHTAYANRKMVEKRQMDEEWMLDRLRLWAEKHGRRPDAERVRESPRSEIPDTTTYIKHFGSWQNALMAAGFVLPEKLPTPHCSDCGAVVPNRNSARCNKCWLKKKMRSDEELLNALRDDPGQPPTCTGYKTPGPGLSVGTITRRFGTWNRALELAGYSPRAKGEHSTWTTPGVKLGKNRQMVTAGAKGTWQA